MHDINAPCNLTQGRIQGLEMLILPLSMILKTLLDRH